METRYIHQFLFVIIFLCAWLSGHAQISPIPVERVDSLMAVNPKPMLFLISTAWCQYCHLQKQQIRKNDTFTQNAEHFYFVELNAEQKETLTFNGKNYVHKPTGINIGIHELALSLNTSQQISYPTWVLLDEQYKPLFKHNGVLNKLQLNALLIAIQQKSQNLE